MAKQKTETAAQGGEEKVQEQTVENTTDKEATEATQEEATNANAKEEAPAAENEVEKLTAELAAQQDKYLRLYSDFDNYRRRTSKEKLELTKTAAERVVTTLLPLLDDFARANNALAEEQKAEKVLNGFNIVVEKLKKELEKEGVKAMDIEKMKGTPFDADTMEAISQFPAPSDDLKGKVIDVVEQGYYLHEKVIRYAKVVTGA